MKKIIAGSFIIANFLYGYNVFNPTGFKATGMGGVGAANAPASLAAYYNPALLLASPNSTEFTFGIGVRYRENNIANNLDTLENLNLDSTIDSIEAAADSTLNSFTDFDSTTITNLIDSGSFTSQDIADAVDTLVENDVITQDTIDTLISDGTIDTDTQQLLEDAGVLDSDGNLVISLSAFSKAPTDVDTTSLLEGLTITLGATQEDRDNIKEIQNIISSLSASNALSISLTTHLSAFIDKNFALGIYMNLDSIIKINTSANHDQLIIEDTGQYVKYDPDTDEVSFTTQEEYTSSSIMYALDNDLISVDAKAILLTEVPLTFCDVSQYLNGYLAYGLNVKYMNMSYTEKTLSLGEGSDSVEDVSDDLNIEFNSNVGIDLGLAYQPAESGTIIGLVAKNINAPKFDFDSRSITVEPAYRLGISKQMFGDTTEIAIDYDITENDTLIEGENSQYISTGIEFHPTSFFAIRTGAMKDIGDNSFNDGYVYSAGLGLGTKWGLLDISAMWADKDGYYDGDDIPRYMKLNVSFVSKWGSR